MFLNYIFHFHVCIIFTVDQLHVISPKFPKLLLQLVLILEGYLRTFGSFYPENDFVLGESQEAQSRVVL